MVSQNVLVYRVILRVQTPYVVAWNLLILAIHIHVVLELSAILHAIQYVFALMAKLETHYAYAKNPQYL